VSIDPARFCQVLQEERQRVENAIAYLKEEHPGTIAEEVEEIGGADNHLAETATATLDREIDYTLEENSGEVLAAIDAALKRIDDGTYGTCTSCGKEIPEARLEASPWASLCIECKRREEEV
jgi:RNA polymerase-binding transcription factor